MDSVILKPINALILSEQLQQLRLPSPRALTRVLQPLITAGTMCTSTSTTPDATPTSTPIAASKPSIAIPIPPALPSPPALENTSFEHHINIPPLALPELL